MFLNTLTKNNGSQLRNNNSFFWWNNKPLIRWFSIYYERTFRPLLVFFLAPCGARKNTTQLAKYPHVLYTKQIFPLGRHKKWCSVLSNRISRKIFGSNRTSERVVQFFRMEYSKRKFVFHSFKAIFDTSFRPSQPFFGTWN